MHGDETAVALDYLHSGSQAKPAALSGLFCCHERVEYLCHRFP
jgi:hypothetical protein